MVIEIRLFEMMGRKNIRTIQQLHELTGLSRTVISNILNGRTNVSLDTIERLCIALDCSINELLVYDKKQTG